MNTHHMNTHHMYTYYMYTYYMYTYYMYLCMAASMSGLNPLRPENFTSAVCSMSCRTSCS